MERMNTTTRSLLAAVLACSLARQAQAQTRPSAGLAAATIEDLMAIRVGAPQNPRRVGVGFSLRLR